MRKITWDLGGRCKLHPSFIVLFMARRTFGSAADGQPQLMGYYFGIQILLSRCGLALGEKESKH